MATGDVMPLAFVSRPPNGDNLLQFDTYRGRRRSQARRRDPGRRRRGHVGRQRALGARAVRGPGRRRRRARPRVELRRHAADLRGARRRVERPRPVRARRRRRGTCRQLTSDDGAPSQGWCGAQLRSGVRARRHRRVRVDARGDADAQEPPAQRGPLPRRARRRLHEARADDLPAQLRDRAGVHAGRPRHASPPRRRRPTSISCPAAA